MCNAWNHSPYCTCGWGGAGHLGRRQASINTHCAYGSSYWWVPPIFHSYESYVNPNALCPVCGAAVFFYQSPNGGRVFFDELGPPWPKHPCTDNNSIPKNTGIASIPRIQFGAINVYDWQKNGWHPFFINEISKIDKYVLQISGSFNGNRLNIYVNRSVNPIIENNVFADATIASIAYVIETLGGNYKLSMVTAFGNSLSVNAFRYRSEATQEQDMISSSAKIFRTKKSNVKLVKKKSTKKGFQEAIEKTALALAYEEALKKQLELKSS
ncbi:hypothetical protein [Methylomicrobium lacus]|uniref:hypothetical protein n=1 Tax=Methylomicrobium lacus TaxID=136992 RepID=UPI0012697A2D|nr:hypothetical protein [Methylomicrobium lacus]